MDVAETKEYCRSFSGAREEELGYPRNILSFSVGGKKFAYFKTSEPEQWRFSVRVSSDRYLELTDQVGINPARYMHRFHWITIVDVGSWPSELVRELVRWSYGKAVSGLSKKAREAAGA
ncbi:MmcQ/YjbR family DNA-binding protein [Microbulbifer harenosus]|uniref:MmcQ/YjbR family DNA-binding protein n=1 Tax=Microbulbifer harenosus TaxID=2576840 RepID=A0ABY2UIX2_9GAMM|nr:hypothetical protein FDY93_10855 [Microbulbifer harenosus]